MSDEDYHLRHHVVESGLTQDEDRLHAEGMAYLQAGIDAGQSWRKVTQGFKMADAELRAIIIDDFLKIALAQRHFQGGEAVKKIAESLGGVPMERMMQAKESMMKEVEEASVAAYHLTKEIERRQSGQG